MKLEPYQETDFTAFVKLLNALATELGGQATDEAAQLEYETWLKRDLGKQRVVVRDPEDPSQLIGYANFFTFKEKEEANLALGVRDKAWGRGLELELLNWLVSQVQPLGMRFLNTYAPGQAANLQSFLEAQGFERAGAYRLLVLEPFSRPQTFALPSGYRLETLRNHRRHGSFRRSEPTQLCRLVGTRCSKRRNLANRTRALRTA